MHTPFHPDRLQHLADLRAQGVEPYPAHAAEWTAASGGRSWAADALQAIAAGSSAAAALHGRVLGRRGYGRLVFLDLVDGSGKLQVCLQKDKLPAAEFARLAALNLGDFCAVAGTLGRTKLGEPTLFAEHFQLLCKALANPPEKWHGLTDVELRARLRYVDLFSNPELRERFHKRAQIFQAMRAVFAAERYLEVDTPVLHPIYGGAAARPFRTHHNALDMTLYLRIAPELYLKRLLVGGLERVYEFARVFRNEGVSPRHNPEFTMLEFYEAYSDYRGMATRTEQLLAAAAAAAGCARDGRLIASFRGRDFDLTPPYPRRRYRDLFQQALGFPPEDQAAVAAAHRAAGLAPAPGHWKAVNDLFEERVEPSLQEPVFVLDYPCAVSPLAKPSPEQPGWAERWEFFVSGMELANSFSELNDPQRQLANFEEQVAGKDPEAPNQVDWDYVRALAYGLPPAGGCGIGMDRLCMLLLGQDSIRDVILFPHLRPEADPA